jgi:hypothetical protein
MYRGQRNVDGEMYDMTKVQLSSDQTRIHLFCNPSYCLGKLLLTVSDKLLLKVTISKLVAMN